MSTSLVKAVMGDNVFEIEILESDSLLEEESVLNTDVQIINLSNLTIYASTLQHEDRCWYAAKLLLVGWYCPYTIHEEYWCNGLTISEKRLRLPIWIWFIVCAKPAQQKCVIESKGSLVRHSMSINDTPAQPWAAFNSAGVVIAGHCNCTAGYV
ncbi:Uncharacterized protein APZ42_026011 [Daphnia magna]|uniref:Uncharacterized protein n=1 Tax=Daphnia magna TaxID=35525 RepID=A0A162EE57_9CRUS|nr:Uncharacterized protein APZ42_026011 [Daphnia magna]